MYKLILSTLVCLFVVAATGCQENSAVNANKPNLEPASNNEAKKSESAPIVDKEQTVTIDAPDGVKLVGTFYAASKPGSAAVLLLHQWQSDRHSYDEFAKRLQARGFGVLSVDGRGFGESTKAADGSTVPVERTDTAVKAMLGDVGAAFDYLSKQKNVNAEKVGIVGASYASSLAIIYAADHSQVKGVALLSPGLNYFGNMQTEPAVKKYGARPLVFFAAEDDKESADAVRKLNPIGQDMPKHPQHIFDSGGHGTALLKVGAADEIGDFFSEIFDLSNRHVKP